MADDNDESVDHEARVNKLHEQFAAAPIVDVLGVVSPSGVGGGNWGGQELWSVSVDLEAWRIEGGELQTRPLDLQNKVTREKLNEIQNALRPYKVVRVKARVVHELFFGRPQALLEEVIGADSSDQELNNKAAELQKPVRFTDPVLGTFTLNRRVSWFTARTKWLRHRWLRPRIDLNLSATGGEDLENAVKTAHAIWQDQKGWDKRIRDFAVEKLLPLKNDCWLSENEAKLTADQFKSRMTLEAITVYPEGSFSFWYNDGDLFWGHSIKIDGDLTEGPNDTDIAG
jgi:hypothetical protein